MTATSKKCPMCAEMIPLEATTCEFCGTQFEVAITGYCQNCHAVRDADEQGCCIICNSEIIDRRVESRLIEIETPDERIPQPVATTPSPAAPRMPNKRIWLWALGSGVVFGIAALAFGLAPKLAPILPPNTSTSTTTATLVPSPTSTSTPSPTSTPRPTVTATPLPAWVTDFAQPILDAIADRPPDVYDDFRNGTSGWKAEDWCSRRVKQVDEELVITECIAHRTGIDYADYVVELDARFLQNFGEWNINFRHSTCPHCSFGVSSTGAVEITLNGPDDLFFDRGAFGGVNTNHLLLIAKGGKFAFFINGKPFSYLEDESKRWGSVSLSIGDGSEDKGTSVAFDNFKIWNIYDISIP